MILARRGWLLSHACGRGTEYDRNKEQNCAHGEQSVRILTKLHRIRVAEDNVLGKFFFPLCGRQFGVDPLPGGLLLLERLQVFHQTIDPALSAVIASLSQRAEHGPPNGHFFGAMRRLVEFSVDDL
jgi:hypothetical protein